MSLGFEFEESLNGTFHTLDAPGDERPMSITVRATAHDLTRFVIDPVAEIAGEIDAAGFADHRALRGTLEINPLLRQRIVYDFRFTTNDEKEHRFHGEQELDARRLLDTMTTLPGNIYQGETEVARAILRFSLSSGLTKLLRTFRPV